MFKNKILGLILGLFVLMTPVLSQNTTSPIGGNGLVIGGIVALGTLAVYEHYRYDDFQSDNGLYVSPGLDLKMLSEGLKLDIRHKVYYKYNRLNPYLVWETFGWIGYESYTGGLDYCLVDSKLSLLIGYETGMIQNQGKRVWTNGINTELRLWTRDNYSISYIGNIKTRPEISKDYVYSGYIHLNIKLGD